MIDHLNFLETSVHGRYVTDASLKKEWLAKLPKAILKVEGLSVLEKEIISVSLGTGKSKILMWSQMHGNESTTTKAVLDVVNYLRSGEPLAESILSSCTLHIIPILNPDGASQYTRVNANNVDLNRDAKQLTQPESRLLRAIFEEFAPEYCFNLHDQRTLFSAGNAQKPATVSFLSPASDQERKLTPSREKSMKLIAAMNALLQELIPGQIGRYDDAFNDNCVGDTFQMRNVPTILFEAGHFPQDYEREQTRRYIFHALLKALETLTDDSIENYTTSDYFKIPENEKLFYDIMVRHPKFIHPAYGEKQYLGIRFRETLKNSAVVFQPELIDAGGLDGYFGHQNYDCSLPNDLKAINSRKEILNLILQKAR